MNRSQAGFTLIELIAVMVVVGVMSIALMSRMDSLNNAGVQEGRDSLIAAFFFAQQTAMARDSVGNNIQLVTTATSVDVTENGNALVGYPVSLSSGVTITAATFNYDKLGRTTAGSITINHTSGTSATITVEASGYVH